MNTLADQRRPSAVGAARSVGLQNSDAPPQQMALERFGHDRLGPAQRAPREPACGRRLLKLRHGLVFDIPAAIPSLVQAFLLLAQIVAKGTYDVETP